MVFTKIEKTDFSPEIGNSNAFSGRITTCTSQLRHPISFGGLFSIFHQKSASKYQKRAILPTSQANGGLEPPPPLLRYWLGSYAELA